MQKLKDPADLSALLLNPSADVGEKYKAIFELKALANEEAQKILISSFYSLDGSELLKHEVAYALGYFSQIHRFGLYSFLKGQMKFTKTVEDFLVSVLCDEKEKPVVRHEVWINHLKLWICNDLGKKAGEALANSENHEMIKVLAGFSSSPSEEVSVTCKLGARKLETYPVLQGFILVFFYG